ncbi:hypothetical protein R3W88_014805 [Solanum pinnatisectum]|uniref:Uncharacterized protein n=1 Tax=Solanum pinnatisectum TaxID=50273 RepID=A0AAV9KSS1_9SOLN|nr:hypothetical protein R3W88_014805 [Solanum pinnatisectum]
MVLYYWWFLIPYLKNRFLIKLKGGENIFRLGFEIFIHKGFTLNYFPVSTTPEFGEAPTTQKPIVPLFLSPLCLQNPFHFPFPIFSGENSNQISTSRASFNTASGNHCSDQLHSPLSRTKPSLPPVKQPPKPLFTSF